MHEMTCLGHCNSRPEKISAAEIEKLVKDLGRFTVNGLRNRDIVAGLYAKPAKDATERKRRSAKVSRQLRMLRAHGILRKVSKTHRYPVTDNGRVILTALHAARHASTEKLVSLAA